MRTRMMVVIWLVALLLVGGVLLGACSGQTPATPEPSPVSEETPATLEPSPVSEETPAIDAVALLEARCVDCHNLTRATSARYTQEQWQEIVTRMIQLGAVLSPDEERALVAYLAETYSP